MAIGNQSMVLHILADDRVLERVLKNSKNQINNFSSDVEKAGKKNQAALSGGFFGRGSKGNQALRGGLSGFGQQSSFLFGSGAFIGASAAAAALKTSIDAASDLNEQITKSQQVFGASDRAILKWSENTAKNIGISQTAALQAAGTFGNLFKAQGIGNARNSQLSKNLVQLAADLASFNNANPVQVLEDLNSAIVGEIEPVRKYGVNLRVARVQQEALAATGKASVKELTQQELTLARLKILYKDTSTAQGDFKRTQGGLANQQRILTAQTQDLAADLGTLLLPAVDGVVTALNEGIGVTLKITGALKALAKVKIPAIHIPFLFDFPGGGGTVGKIAGGVAKFGGLAAVSPLGAVVKTVHDQLVGDAKRETKSATPKLAKDFKDAFTPFTQDALDNAINIRGFLKVPKINPGKVLGNLIDNLNLKLDKSELTETASDNISILRDLVKAYETEVKLGIDVKNASKNLVAARKQLQDATKGAASDTFSKIIDNLGLGVEKAGLTKSLNDDVSALQAVKAGLLNQIKAGVDVQSAQHQLVAVQGQIASTQEQIKQNGIDKILTGLQAGVDKAKLTKGLADDLKALQAQAAGIRAQIAAGNDVASQQSNLVSVLQQIQGLQEQIAQNKQDALKASAFKQIGLSAEGGEIIPGVSNLKKQLSQLKSNLPNEMGTTLRKLVNRLGGVGKVLSDPIKSSIPEVRAAIKDLFDAIRGEMDSQTKNGPLTKTTALNTNKVIRGLGLDANTTKELRSRLSKFNSAGVALAGPGVAASKGGFPNFGAPAVVVNVELDGQKVEKNVTVRQQRRGNRNPTQKRGPIGGKI